MVYKSKKERFRQETLSLIQKRGYDATSMRDIAENLGCDVSNIYNYIPSKKSLLEDVLFEISNRFHAGIDEILSSELSVVEQIKLLVRMYVQMSIERPLEVSLLVHDWRSLIDNRREVFINEKNRYEDKVRQIIRSGISQGVFVIPEEDLLLFVLLSNLRWLFERTLDTENNINALDLEYKLQKIIINALIVNGK